MSQPAHHPPSVPDRATLVREHGPLVYGLCRRLAPDPEDCYQEVWEKVFRALPGFDPTGRATVRTWIATVARRHLIDRHRRRKVRGEVLELGELPSRGPDPSEVIARQQRHDRLEAGIRRLPEGQRRVVVLHHLHGVPLEGIASEEGISVGTVKSRLHRGRARLAELMGGGR